MKLRFLVVVTGITSGIAYTARFAAHVVVRGVSVPAHPEFGADRLHEIFLIIEVVAVQVTFIR